MINAIEAWSLNHNIRRIEATVVPENDGAVNLFKSAGFQIEGELKDKLYINNKYYNEYVMAKNFKLIVYGNYILNFII